jgi:hypothetical protein
MPEELKTCSKCHQEKPKNQFSVQSSCKSGLNPRCKECISEINRENYNNNKMGVSKIITVTGSKIKSKNDLKPGAIIRFLVSRSRRMNNSKAYISNNLDEIRAICSEAV